jgi:hypothetical protein
MNDDGDDVDIQSVNFDYDIQVDGSCDGDCDGSASVEALCVG